MKQAKNDKPNHENACCSCRADGGAHAHTEVCEHHNHYNTDQNIKQRSFLLKLIPASVVGALAGASLLFYNHFHVVLCPLYNFAGIPCPMCGMTRAWLDLGRGKVKEAFKMHPLLLLAPVLFLFIILSGSAKYARRRWVKAGLLLVCAIFILVWICRMILLFPGTEPMTFNHNAVIPRILDLLRSLSEIF